MWREFGREYWLLLMVSAFFSMHATETAAADIETLVMPGPVIAGHADIESTCSSCHARFSRDKQRELCLDCHDHEDVAGDVSAGVGFHGLSAEVAEQTCAACHTEHVGRDADVVGLDPETFDHEVTDFPLTGGHIEVDCEDCHAPDEKYRAAPQGCVDCHLEDDNHDGGLGEECADCHVTKDWLTTEFDHEATSDYALTGGHADIECTDCHIDNSFEKTPTECIDCHREDDEHRGSNGDDCAFCHVTRSWDESSFDHERETEFALLGKHGEIACSDCHVDNIFDAPLEAECISCHLEDDEHDGLNGTQCDDCHDNTDWADVTFDHARDTEFELLGKHAEAECSDCHTEPVWEVALESDCSSCHLEDDPHDGQQGEQCGDCHNEKGWQDAVVFDHGLTRFPLVGKHVETECEDCHETPQFQDASEQCIDCHQEDDSHEASLGTQCGDCHNPNDWLLWEFDHDLQTDFLLEGAHFELACNDCHRVPVTERIALASQCGACHRRDDVHDGQFGKDCERCHTTESFEGATRIH